MDCFLWAVYLAKLVSHHCLSAIVERERENGYFKATHVHQMQDLASASRDWAPKSPTKPNKGFELKSSVQGVAGVRGAQVK